MGGIFPNCANQKKKMSARRRSCSILAQSFFGDENIERIARGVAACKAVR